MLAKVDPWIMRLVSVLVATGLYLLAARYTDVANDLKVLAGVVLGWLALPRPGDSRPAGHVDDVDGGRW